MQYKGNAETIETVERAVFSEIGFLRGGKIELTITIKNKEKNKTERRKGYIAEVRKSKKRQKLLPKACPFYSKKLQAKTSAKQKSNIKKNGKK